MGLQFSSIVKTRGAIPILFALAIFGYQKRKSNKRKARAAKKKRAEKAAADCRFKSVL